MNQPSFPSEQQVRVVYVKKKSGCFSKIMIGIVVLIVVSGIISALNKDDKQTAGAENKPLAVVSGSNNTNQPTSVPKPPIPQDQALLIEKSESFYDSYMNAPNELKKSSIRTDRKTAIQEVLSSRKVEHWVGVLTEMRTNTEGKAFITIKLAGSSNVVVKTWNNSLSDFDSNTMIASDSPLYAIISELAIGDTVVFSGQFLSDDRDYIKEGSLTEQGSMTAPEFIIQFTDIKKQ